MTFFPPVNMLTDDELAAELTAWEQDEAMGFATAMSSRRIRLIRDELDWRDTARDKAAMYNGQ